ncbi:hypothetical protein GVX76_08240 [[Haemophilus] felis]|nr:hypothetical protein [[Haemophilus] felis]
MSTNQIDLMKLFQRIKWAENGDTVPFTETNYGTGWSFLGDDTPTVEDFNTLQQWNDKKDQWLYGQIAKVCQEEGIQVTESDLSALLKAIKKIAEQPQATTQQVGITQLDSSTNSNAEDRAATPKAVKQVNDKVERNARSLNERIPNSKKSSATDSNSSDTVATSRAVKTAYDLANSKQSPATTLAGYGIADFQLRTATGNLNDYRTAGIYSINSIHNSHNRPAEGVRQSQGFTGNLQVITGGAGNESWCHQIFYRHYSDEVYERYQTASNSSNWSEWKKRGADGIPVGSVVAFPKEITNPQGFLRCDGTTFSQNTYPDLYRVLGNKNRLPNLTRSDVGQLAYFPTDTIPEGWIAFDSIRSVVNATSYPELYRYLIGKYRSISNVPLAEDRFIRNAGNGLGVGETQEDAIRNIRGELKSIFGSDRYALYTTGSGVFEVTGRQADYSFDVGGHHGKKDTTIFDASKVVPTANENRPKSIIFKLCIKAKNSFDDVQFWIKAFGEVTNAGTLDAGRLAQNLQDKADRAHTHTVSQITDFNPEVVKLINQHSGFTQNISTNGWTVLPNGLMIQWGVATTNDILFPRAFPRECFIVSHSKTGGGRDTRISNVSRTGFASFATITVGTTYYVAIGH